MYLYASIADRLTPVPGIDLSIRGHVLLVLDRFPQDRHSSEAAYVQWVYDIHALPTLAYIPFTPPMAG